MPETHGIIARRWDENYERDIRSSWVQNPQIQREVNRRMTGKAERFWLQWFFEDFTHRKIGRVLSIGCGNGAHELLIASNGYADYVYGFDASPSGIKQASNLAREQGLQAEFSVGYFEDFTKQPPDMKFDLVLFAGSLHHCVNIEEILMAARSALVPSGMILVNEYVGPCYQLYPAERLQIINRVLAGLESKFKKSPEIQLSLPTIEQIFANDPTEGVRSSLIQPFLPLFFEPIFERGFGGALLHPLFDCLNSRKVNDGSPESETLINNLILLENELTRLGCVKDDFLFACYKQT